MPFEDPLGVVQVLESQQRQPQFLDGVEVYHPQQVFLEQADEALGTADMTP